VSFRLISDTVPTASKNCPNKPRNAVRIASEQCPNWIGTLSELNRNPVRFAPEYTQIRQPAQTWCLIDEDGSTINDSLFAVWMGDVNGIYDLPSTRHGKVYPLSFADGHVESINWQGDSSDWNGGELDPSPDWVNLKSMTTFKK